MKYILILTKDSDYPEHVAENVIGLVDDMWHDNLEEVIALRDEMRANNPTCEYEVFALIKR